MRRSMSFVFVVSLAHFGCGDDGGGAGDGSTGGSTTDITTSSSSSTTAEASSSSGADTSTGGDSTTSGGSSSGSSSTGTPAAPVDVSGQVSVFRSGDPVAEGEVCWVADGVADPCTTTDAEGQFTLEDVPGESQGALRFVDDQIASFAVILATADEDIELPAGFSIDSPDVLGGYFEQTGVEAAAGGVAVIAQAYPLQAGYTIKLTPISGDGPFYYRDNPGEIDPKAIETASPSVGLYLNVVADEGPFDIQFSSAKALCDQPHFGGPLEPWSIPDGVESVYVALDCV